MAPQAREALVPWGSARAVDAPESPRALLGDMEARGQGKLMGAVGEFGAWKIEGCGTLGVPRARVPWLVFLVLRSWFCFVGSARCFSFFRVLGFLYERSRCSKLGQVVWRVGT